MGSPKPSKTNVTARERHDPRPKIERVYTCVRTPKGGLSLKAENVPINRDPLP